MFTFKQLKHKVVTAILLGAIFVGCKSQFEKVRQGTDVAKKYSEALKLYNQRKYEKANILFEELAQKYRGREQAEDLNYYYAYTSYRMDNFPLALEQFKTFAESYPNSKYAEECRFMSAYCYYLQSPKSSLDQSSTLKAIAALQLFNSYYPKSERVIEANKYIDDLKSKLDTKDFDNAQLYLDIGYFNSAVISLENVQKDHPDTKYDEMLGFLAIKAQYLYAKQSYAFRQEDRFNKVKDMVVTFSDNFPESKFIKEIKEFEKDSDVGIKNAKKELLYIASNQDKVRAYLKRFSTASDSTAIEENLYKATQADSLKNK